MNIAIIKNKEQRRVCTGASHGAAGNRWLRETKIGLDGIGGCAEPRVGIYSYDRQKVRQRDRRTIGQIEVEGIRRIEHTEEIKTIPPGPRIRKRSSAGDRGRISSLRWRERRRCDNAKQQPLVKTHISAPH